MCLLALLICIIIIEYYTVACTQLSTELIITWLNSGRILHMQQSSIKKNKIETICVNCICANVFSGQFYLFRIPSYCREMCMCAFTTTQHTHTRISKIPFFCNFNLRIEFTCVVRGFCHFFSLFCSLLFYFALFVWPHPMTPYTEKIVENTNFSIYVN